MGLFPRVSWIREGGQPEISLLSAQNVLKCSPPSSPQIWQGTTFLCQVRCGDANADANALPWPQLGPGSPVGQCCPAGDKGTLCWGGACWWHRMRKGQVGQCSPSTATPPSSLGCPLHDSPLHVVQGGSLPEVLGVPGLLGCPEGRKTWGHCRDGLSPVGAWCVPWERRPDSASSSGKHPCQIRTSLASSWHPPTQQGGPQWLHPVPMARSHQLHAEVGGHSDMGDTQTPTGRPSTPGKPGKPCKEPRQSQRASRTPPPPSSPACPPRDAPRSWRAVSSPGYLWEEGPGSPLKPCGLCAGGGRR